MAKFAVLSTLDGIAGVGNIIICDDKETAEAITNLNCIEIPSDLAVETHWSYNYSTQEFIKPWKDEENA
jgi:hypothetical protein